MRFIICNPKSKKLLTVSTFQNIHDCMMEVSEKVKFWQKQCKKKKIPTDRLKAWKNSVFLEINWEREVFGDTSIVVKEESSRNTKNSQSKMLKQYDNTLISNSVDKAIVNGTSKFKRYSKS